MLWIVATLVALVNIPFGFWRAGVRKFSPSWFVAVHAPVPLAVGLRFASGLGFRWTTLPLFVAAFFGGQMLGARLRRLRELRTARLRLARTSHPLSAAAPPANKGASDSPS
ncbi:MAG: hypothetical protein ABI689_00145 [Thermoanaerobaculia bacterium]